MAAHWWADFFIRWITQELDVVCSFQKQFLTLKNYLFGPSFGLLRAFLCTAGSPNYSHFASKGKNGLKFAMAAAVAFLSPEAKFSNILQQLAAITLLSLKKCDVGTGIPTYLNHKGFVLEVLKSYLRE
jgi:hypothetical protein